MADSTKPARGAADGPLGVTLDELAKFAAQQTQILTQLLSVAKHGPGAGGAGVPGVGGAGGGSAAARGSAAAAAAVADQRWQQQQKDIYERSRALSQIGLGGIGGRASGYAAMGDGLRTLGFGGLGGMVSRAALPLAAGGAALDTGASAMRAFSDPLATSEQKWRTFARSLPLGETATSLVDSYTGRAAAMERAKIASDLERPDVQGRLRAGGYSLSSAPELAGRSGLASAYAGSSAVTARLFDRSTARGEVQAREEAMMLGYRRDSAKAERDLAVATSQRVGVQKELNTLNARHTDLGRQRAAIDEKLKEFEGGPVRAHLLMQKRNILEEQAGVSALKEQALHNLDAARGRETAAEAEKFKAYTRQNLIGRAEVLESRAGRSQATATRLGSMDPFQRAMGMNVLEMVKGGANLDLLPPEMKALAQQVAPDEFAKMAQAHGEGTAEFRRGHKAGLVGFEGRASDLYGEADRLRNKAAENEFSIEGKAAEESAKSARQISDVIKKVIQVHTDELRREIEAQLLIGRAMS